MTFARSSLASLLLLTACPIDGTPSDSTTGDSDDSTGGSEPTMSGSATSPTSPSTTMPTTTEPTTTGPDTDTSGIETTIYDIQMGNVPEGTFVTITDVVVTSQVQTNDGGFTVQDPESGPYSGIYIFVFEDVIGGLSVSPGDVVTITGEYSEFFDFSQISLGDTADLVVTGSADVPAPEVVAAADVAVGGSAAESFESVLVRVEDLTATDATNRFGDTRVDGGLIISNFFLFEQDDQLDVLPGTTFGFVQGPLLYNFEEFKVAPRGADDYDAMLIPCADAAVPGTIFELQQGAFAEDDFVLVENVVVTTPLTFTGDGFWVQDPMGGEESGISVFVLDTAGLDVEPGDEVTICGAYAEFFDQSQLAVAAVADINVSGTVPVPAAEVLTSAEAATEVWEGVLVQIDNPVVTVEPNDFGEWEIDDALLATDTFFEEADWPQPAVDDTFTSLTGVIEFSFENFKIAPRDADDLVP